MLLDGSFSRCSLREQSFLEAHEKSMEIRMIRGANHDCDFANSSRSEPRQWIRFRTHQQTSRSGIKVASVLAWAHLQVQQFPQSSSSLPTTSQQQYPSLERTK